MSKVFINEETLVDIGNAIREKEGSSELIPPLEMGNRIRAIQSGEGLVWTDFAVSLQIYSFNELKESSVDLYLPKIKSLAQFCSVSNDNEAINTTVEQLTLRCDRQITSMASMLSCSYNQYDRTLRRVNLYVDTSEVGTMSYAFSGLRMLEEIGGTPIDMSSVTSTGSMFSYCYALREVKFKGTLKTSLIMSDSKNLSRDSIISILDGLSSDTSGLAVTLARAAVDAAFEAAEGAADGSSSMEWEALVAEHTNWTITLR